MTAAKNGAFVIGLDAGTTCFKAGLYDRDLQTVAFASETYDLTYTPEGFIECNPDTYWDITCRLVRRLLEESGVSPAQVQGLSISSQGETLIFLDENGRPLRPAIVWTDARAAAEKDRLREQFPDPVLFEVTGQREMTAGWPAAKWLWVREHEPQVAAKTRHLLLLGDYLAYRFTGCFGSSRSLSTSTTYMDIRSGEWWQDMLDTIALPVEYLPTLCHSTAVIGSLTPTAAAQTGLTTAARVMGGAMDQAAGMLGSGNIAAGMVSETTGTCLAVCAHLGAVRPPFEKGHLPIHYGLTDGTYYAIYWSGAAGSIFRWVRNTFYSELPEDTVYRRMDDDAAAVPPGAEGLTLMPYLSGINYPFACDEAKGEISGLTLFHRRGHFARAVLESVAFLLRQSLDELEGYGQETGKMRSLGGGAVSPVWCQIKADMTGQPIYASRRREETCFGAAVMAAVGTGLFADFSAALSHAAAPEIGYMPQNTAAYAPVYAHMQALAETYYAQYRDTLPTETA